VCASLFMCACARVWARVCVWMKMHAQVYIHTRLHIQWGNMGNLSTAQTLLSSRTFAQHVSSHIMCTHAQHTNNKHTNNKALFPQKNLIQQPQKSLYICVYIYIYIANIHVYIAARSSMVCTHESNAHL